MSTCCNPSDARVISQNSHRVVEVTGDEYNVNRLDSTIVVVVDPDATESPILVLPAQGRADETHKIVASGGDVRVQTDTDDNDDPVYVIVPAGQTWVFSFINCEWTANVLTPPAPVP